MKIYLILFTKTSLKIVNSKIDPWIKSRISGFISSSSSSPRNLHHHHPLFYIFTMFIQHNFFFSISHFSATNKPIKQPKSQKFQIFFNFIKQSKPIKFFPFFQIKILSAKRAWISHPEVIIIPINLVFKINKELCFNTQTKKLNLYN